jgi:hypothetical protein
MNSRITFAMGGRSLQMRIALISALKHWLGCLTSVFVAILLAEHGMLGAVMAQPPSGVTLFQNVRIFDGQGAELSSPAMTWFAGTKEGVKALHIIVMA